MNGTSHAPLRCGLVVAPSGGLFFVDASYRGVAADIAALIARAVDRTLTPTPFPNSGACTEALARGEIDMAFMPVDAQRAAQVAFGPAYYVVESTFLVIGHAHVRTIAEVDRDDLRVIGIANTTTIRAAARTLTHTAPTPIDTVEAALAALRDGHADVIALSRDVLAPLTAQFAGSRVVDGAFQTTRVALAVPPSRAQDALPPLAHALRAAKADGRIHAIFAAHGFAHEAVAAAD